MMEENLHCTIQIAGHLPEKWRDWFGGLEIGSRPNGDAVLAGWLPETGMSRCIEGYNISFDRVLLAPIQCASTNGEVKATSCSDAC